MFLLTLWKTNLRVHLSVTESVLNLESLCTCSDVSLEINEVHLNVQTGESKHVEHSHAYQAAYLSRPPGALSALIQFPRANSDRLMCCPSTILSPVNKRARKWHSDSSLNRYGKMRANHPVRSDPFLQAFRSVIETASFTANWALSDDAYPYFEFVQLAPTQPDHTWRNSNAVRNGNHERRADDSVFHSQC